MMSMSQWFGSEPGLALVGGAVGTVWAFFRSRGWYERARNRRYGRAIQALEAGVDRAYRAYVRGIKQGRSDGKLTEDEIRQARQLARQTAIDYGRSEGIDVIRELGAGYVDVWMSKLVRRSRRKR